MLLLTKHLSYIRTKPLCYKLNLCATNYVPKPRCYSLNLYATITKTNLLQQLLRIVAHKLNLYPPNYVLYLNIHAAN